MQYRARGYLLALPRTPSEENTFTVRHWLRAIVIAAIAASCLVASTGVSSAYYLGSGWNWSAGGPCCLLLNYANTMDTSQPYGYEFDQGATDWLNTASVIAPQKVAYGSGQVVTGRGYSDTNPDIGGYTTIYAQICGLSGCGTEPLPSGQQCASPCPVYDANGYKFGGYNNVTIEVNRTGYCVNPAAYGYTWSTWSCFNAIAGHELGHAWGLAHAPCQGPLMYALTQDGIKTPQAMDVSDINQLYPNSAWSPGKTTC
jgi:hypothetical protein